MASGDIVEAVFACRFGEQLGLNVRHYLSASSVGTGIGMSSLATALSGAIGPLFVPLLSVQAQFEGVTVKKIFPLPAGMPVKSPQSALIGTVAGDPIPKQVSGLIAYQTQFSGRAFRGRSYIPFPGEASSDPTEARPTGSYNAAMITLAGQLMVTVALAEGANTETFVPIIWHRATSTFTEIANAMVRTVWATQRRRGDFGRTNPVSSAGVLVPIAP